MARSLSLSLAKVYQTTAATTSSSSSAASAVSAARFFSNLPNNTDPAIEESSTTDPLLRRLEDAIHRIIVRRSAPDWLPFLPGSSYWVPPPRSGSGSLGIAQLVEKLANPLTDEESLSTTSVRGWPSSDYYIKVGAPPQTIEVKVTSGEMEAASTSNRGSKSEDEEG